MRLRPLRPRKPATPVVPAPACVPPACADLDAMPELFAPLVAELMGAFCHTRQLGALAQNELCPAEYQMVARSIVQHVLEGWTHQTGGRGSIDDLLLESRASATAEVPSPHAADFPTAREHRLAS
ncbi:hypothetical protein ACWD4T_00510 [Streptomyces umbrinus]